MRVDNAEALGVLGKVFAEEKCVESEKRITENWKNVEVDPQDPKCKLIYGVEHGDVFAHAAQEDFDDYIKLAAEYRMLENENKGKDSWLGKIKWIMPRIVKLEMEARGYPIDEMVREGDLYEIDCFIEKNFPELKTTNLILKHGKLPKLG